MAKERLVAFSEDGWREYQSFIRNQQRQANVQRRDFRKKYPILQGSGGGEEECPKNWFKIRPIIVPTSGTPTFNLIIHVNGTDYAVNTIAYTAASTTIKSAIEAAVTIFTTDPDYGIAISTGTLPGDVISILFTVPDGIAFYCRRGTQSTTTNFYYQVDPMSKPE